MDADLLSVLLRPQTLYAFPHDADSQIHTLTLRSHRRQVNILLTGLQAPDELFHRQVPMALASAADKGNPGPQRGRRNQ